MEQVQQATFYNQPDEIVWCWTTDGIYSVKSAYSIQCSVSFSWFDGNSISKAHAEGKAKIVCLAFGSDQQTNLRLGMYLWSKCLLCDLGQALVTHLCLQCTFTTEVWFLVRSWKGIAFQVPTDNASVGDWWHASLSNLPRQQQRRKAALMIDTTWNMEGRNHRVSDGRFQEPVQVLQLIKEEVDLCRQACWELAAA